MTSTTTLAAAPTQPRTGFSYGWDRTPYSPDEFRDIRDSGVPELAPADDFEPKDFLSIINPLHHLPVVGTIYRAITGERLHPAARAIGGALFGGPMGLIGAFAQGVIEKKTGVDVGDAIVAAIIPKPASQSPDPAIARQQPPAPPAAPRTLGERLAAVVLPETATDAAASAPSLGQRVVAVALPDRAPAAPARATTSPSLGERLAAVFLPDRPAARPEPPTDAVAQVDPAAQAAALAQIAPAAGRGGRALADYQARPVEMPGIGAIARATLRQPSGLRTAPAALAAASLVTTNTEKGDATQSDERSAGPTPHATLSEAPVNAWFAERMLMGLDVYRNAKRSPNRPQVDRLE